VAVYFSGGLNSLALLGLIIEELKNTGRSDMPLVAFTVAKKISTAEYAEELIKIISERSGLEIQHLNDIENNEPAYSFGRLGRVPLIKLWDQYHNDTVIYAGMSVMAPDNIRPFEQKLRVQYPPESRYFLMPFYDLIKPEVVELLHHLGYEDLIDLTHSCTTQSAGACGQCYSCMDRRWGLSSLKNRQTSELKKIYNDHSVKIRDLTPEETASFYQEARGIVHWTKHAEKSETALGEGDTLHVNWFTNKARNASSVDFLVPYTMEFIRKEFGDKKIGRCYWHKLSPGQQIRPHLDMLDYVDDDTVVTRYQVYLDIPNGVNLVFDEKKHRPDDWARSLVGFCYSKLHAYENRSLEDFYILVFDILECRQ